MKEKKLRVLLLTDEAWNDALFRNNVHTNWFSDAPIEIANIYRSGALPNNSVCRLYFQISDSDLIHAILKREECGKKLPEIDYSNVVEGECPPILEVRINRYKNDFVRMARNLMWISNRWKTRALELFIREFDPDIIFSPRYARYGFLRIEEYVVNIAQKPIVAFTADDEYSCKQIKISPSWWISRLMTRHILKRLAPNYACYYTFSESQAKFYQKEFGCKTGVVYKTGDFSKPPELSYGKPIRIIYAGKLYCNRWKTLLALAHKLDEINANETMISLDIFATENDTKFLHRFRKYDSVQIRPAVDQKTLFKVFSNYDIALHVEAFNLKNRMEVRYSFSTKIIDYMASGCAVMALCGSDNAGYQYLKNSGCALCASSIDEMNALIDRIVNNPEEIAAYKRKVFEFGRDHHSNTQLKNQVYNALLMLSDKENCVSK